MSPTKKIAVLGQAKSLAAFNDDGTYIKYGLPWCPEHIELDCDVYFDIHDFDGANRTVSSDYPKILEGLIDEGKKVFGNGHKNTYVKRMDEYPLTAVVHRLNSACSAANPFPYFRSSVAYMLGLAFLENATTVQVSGVDLTDKFEYMTQRPNIEFMLGVMAASGVEIEIPTLSALLKPTNVLYGYEPTTLSDHAITKKHLVARQQAHQGGLEAAKQQFYRLEGALLELQDLLTFLQGVDIGVAPALFREELLNRITSMNGEGF